MPVDDGRRTRLAALDHADADWAGLHVVVFGLGVSGYAAADALLQRGAHLTVLSGAPTDHQREQATVLEILGAVVRFGAEHQQRPGPGTDLVVTSPGIPPTHPYMRAAAAAAVPVWGEVELAWRMRPREGAAPWLSITGTNGKTTTVTMLERILQAGGLRAIAAGNVGTPLVEAVLHPQPYDVLAVELSTFQLHWSSSLSPYASCCLNVAPDHLDWHGSYEEYRRMKGRVYERTQRACVYNEDDSTTRELVEDADVVDGARAIGFTLGLPGPSMLGVVDGVLADRAFVPDRRYAAQLCTVAELAAGDEAPSPHYVADALAAAALARSYDVPPAAVRAGLVGYTPQPHRGQVVATGAGVRWIDDSKATNPGAAAAALRAVEHVVWVAGGQLKGADVEDLVRDAAPRLRAAVLLGADREVIAQVLRRHAPDVPVVQIDSIQTDAMDLAVTEAARLARPGDVVLLAPAAASKDMFSGYPERGDLFAQAARRVSGAGR
ncbi:UDP-N-acetylmuramoyl-L-alanine--D-glutamate ligase [Allobranchiibius huperziae]|uniref:UDP-N-acetylmuramoylalanine--D-glutamate ligase n=1 Tax=Allobranchiibius huperziae TaxID=1874116 RepID=A0A853DGF4_9MICO|nr:UDP-N-acetylmuramoyl-L-alanine--D-glutamate ligase [Allobranchiibius huperziae]NYJ75113.1 UDP-N-acetylmuramoylalanine--D-glutamate ligase [Allobranchiibius huperziae]